MEPHKDMMQSAIANFYKAMEGSKKPEDPALITAGFQVLACFLECVASMADDLERIANK